MTIITYLNKINIVKRHLNDSLSKLNHHNSKCKSIINQPLCRPCRADDEYLIMSHAVGFLPPAIHPRLCICRPCRADLSQAPQSLPWVPCLAAVHPRLCTCHPCRADLSQAPQSLPRVPCLAAVHPRLCTYRPCRADLSQLPNSPAVGSLPGGSTPTVMHLSPF
jgi:hypothetical protein